MAVGRASFSKMCGPLQVSPGHGSARRNGTFVQDWPDEMAGRPLDTPATNACLLSIVPVNSNRPRKHAQSPVWRYPASRPGFHASLPGSSYGKRQLLHARSMSRCMTAFSSAWCSMAAPSRGSRLDGVFGSALRGPSWWNSIPAAGLSRAVQHQQVELPCAAVTVRSPNGSRPHGRRGKSRSRGDQHLQGFAVLFAEAARTLGFGVRTRAGCFRIGEQTLVGSLDSGSAPA